MNSPRVGRGPEHVDAPGGEVDDEDRVIRDEAPPRPDLRRKEIRPGDGAPMRSEKRLPRGGPLRDRGQARRLQDPPNRRAAHAVADVLQRALDPRVNPTSDSPPPSGSQVAGSRATRRAVRAVVRVRPFPRNQLTMPPQQACPASRSWRCRVGPPADPVGPRGQPPAIASVRRSRRPQAAGAGAGFLR